MNKPINKLLGLKCREYSATEPKMNLTEIEEHRRHVPEWQYCATDNELRRTYRFDTYKDTIDFVNMVAAIADEQDHHPSMEVDYRRCKVRFFTHTVNGVTLNDFICAARIDDQADKR